MKIRPAAQTDAGPVAALWNEMIRDTDATFTTQEKQIDDIAALIAARKGAFWVADAKGLHGFVTYGAFRDGPGYAATVEHTIILAQAAQGRGVGRMLMRRAIEGAQTQGHHVMIAAISGTNPGAIIFHRKLGFEQTARMPQVGRKGGRWLDLILMQKIISTP